MKSKLLKKMLSAVLAGTVVFCMTACSSGTGSEDTAAGQAAESTDAQETAETADAGQEDNTESAAENAGEEDSAENSAENGDEEGGALIVYFSWSGNTEAVAPFNTSGGSGFSNSLENIAEMEPDARITEGLSLGSSEAEDCADTVSGWLGSIGLAE